MKHMKLMGVRDLIPFLQYMDQKRIMYKIERQRDDSLMVTFATFGKRIELDFFESHIEYSVFEGNEDVLDDQERLFSEIEKFS